MLGLRDSQRSEKAHHAITGRVAFPAVLGYYCAHEKFKIVAGGCTLAVLVCRGVGSDLAGAGAGTNKPYERTQFAPA